jgi:hypothetical protein
MSHTLNHSQPKKKSNTKVSAAWNNVEETPDVPKPPKSSKRDKKRNKTGKSEKRTQEIRKNKITVQGSKN